MKMLMFDVRETEKELLKKLNLKDIDVTYFEEPLNENTKLTEEQLQETDIISIFIFSNLTEEVLSKFKNLRVIATRSTGFNHIDIDYCSKKNIAVLNVDKYGLDTIDIEYLEALINKFNGGPVGVETISTAIGEEITTIEDVVEPFLLQEGFIKRTRSGRVATEKSYEHLGIDHNRSLFESGGLF